MGKRRSPIGCLGFTVVFWMTLSNKPSWCDGTEEPEGKTNFSMVVVAYLSLFLAAVTSNEERGMNG